MTAESFALLPSSLTSLSVSPADGLMNTVKRTEEIDYFPSRNNQTVGYVLFAYMLCQTH